MRRWIALFCALSWANAAIAAEEPVVGPIPDWVAPVEAPLDAAGQPNAGAEFLLLEEQVRLSPGGEELFQRLVARVQTSQGLANLGTLMAEWRPEHQTVTFHKVDIIRGDEVIDALGDGESVTTLRRENFLEYSVLNGVHTAAVQLAGLRVGDIVDFAATVSGSDPVLQGVPQYVGATFNGTPLSRAYLRVLWDEDDAVRWRVTEDIAGLEEDQTGGMTEIVWDAEDVEPIQYPLGAPARYALGRRFEASGFSEWGEVASMLAPLYAETAVIGADTELRDELERIRAASDSPRARAEAALRLVQDQIRYLFLGMNDGGLVPATADETWTRRFGDCKGKTAVLLALLHELGIDAEPVAVSTMAGDGMDRRLPMVKHFDHVLVRAHIDGETVWMDGARTGDRSLQDLTVPPYRWGLALVPDGELVRLDVEPLARPKMETFLEVDASAGLDEAVPARLEIVYRAEQAALIRAQLSAVPQSRRDEALRAFLTQTMDFDRVDSVSARYDEDAAEQHMELEGRLDLDWEPGEPYRSKANLQLDGLLIERPESQARAPYTIAHPVFTAARERVILPANEDFALQGESVDRTVAGFNFTRSATLEDGVFEAEAALRSMALELPQDEAQALLDTVSELKDQPMGVAVVERAGWRRFAPQWPWWPFGRARQAGE